MARRNSVQELRQSQFVLTFGPGSIIEGENGSRLIPNVNIGLGNRFSKSFLDENKVSDFRMRSVVGKLDDTNKVNLFSIPSNASLNLPSYYATYSTSVFPAWHVCHNTKDHPTKDSILYNGLFRGGKCPVCDKGDNPNIRFVCACPDGHLDDVDWKFAVHRNNDGSYSHECNPRYYYWKQREGSDSLANVIIQCPDCNKSVSMYEVYRTPFFCSGRHPEHESFRFSDSKVGYSEPDRPRNCKKRMKVLQKQSTSLRIANTISLLKIPKFDKKIYEILDGTVKDVINVAIDLADDGNKFLNTIKTLGGLSKLDYEEVESYIHEKGYDDFKQMVTNVGDYSIEYADALEEEFDTLLGNSVSSPNFSKSEFKEYELVKPSDYKFPIKVCSIDKITTVTAQFSYQRKPYSSEEGDFGTVSSGYRHYEGDMWYPAYVGVGEGIFITSDLNPLEELNLQDIAKIWEDNMPKFRLIKREGIKNPLFVWWHTLAHAIIKSLSISSGYASTSLHERVYVDNEKGLGGILIYNTSPGDDSGMGGLVDTVKSFNIVLKNAMNSLLFCSNDPLCSYEKLEDNGIVGAACHNCLLISETSCEVQNVLLDRHFFI